MPGVVYSVVLAAGEAADDAGDVADLALEQVSELCAWASAQEGIGDQADGDGVDLGFRA